MNRADALAYAQQEYAELATETGLSPSALLAAYTTAIDHSLRGLGVPESALATYESQDSQVVSYLALLDYYVLVRFARVFALRADVNVAGSVSTTQSQVYKQVAALRDAALARLDGLGLSPTETMTMGRFTLDFNEPSYPLGTAGMG